MTKEELIRFEEEIGDLYKQGRIRAPVHLSGGNEDQLIEIFKKIKSSDWIFSTWRSHYHWLLSGRPPEGLRQQILEGHSMHVFGKKFFTSAIIGGIAPIAVGVAIALKRGKTKDRVWCFLGDMGASAGIATESIRYACGHDLPITFIIEDNGISVKTDTRMSWGCKECKVDHKDKGFCQYLETDKVRCYRYDRKYPHSGIGVFVSF